MYSSAMDLCRDSNSFSIFNREFFYCQVSLFLRSENSSDAALKIVIL